MFPLISLKCDRICPYVYKNRCGRLYCYFQHKEKDLVESPKANRLNDLTCLSPNLVKQQKENSPISTNKRISHFQNGQVDNSASKFKMVAKARVAKNPSNAIQPENIKSLNIIYKHQSKVPDKSRIEYLKYLYNLIDSRLDEKERIVMAVTEEFRNLENSNSKNVYASLCIASARKFKSLTFEDGELKEKIALDKIYYGEKKYNTEDFCKTLKERYISKIHDYEDFLKQSLPNNGFSMMSFILRDNHRRCCRCESIFSLDDNENKCNYHYGKAFYSHGNNRNGVRVYTCCGKPFPSSPCSYNKYHVFEDFNINIQDFVSTSEWKKTEKTLPVAAVDCEMSYTNNGLELTRVTLVDDQLSTVYDQFVKPDTLVRDYNTMYSGITEENLLTCKKSLKDVHNDLSKLICEETILIGHGIQNDLRVLKIIHENIVDTTVVFPHPSAGQLKFSLKKLALNVLGLDIQNSKGHDSAEDAATCIRLMRAKYEML